MERRIQLIELLTTYRPADATESDHRARMIGLTESEGDPCSRSRFDPGHFTVSAFVVPIRGRSVLMIFHEKLERWLQPGGHLEVDDEDLLAAARREVVEETGLGEACLEPLGTVALDLDVHEIPATKLEPGHLHFDLRFLFRAHTTSVVPVDDQDSVRWVGLDEAATLNPEPAMSRVLSKLAAIPALCSEED